MPMGREWIEKGSMSRSNEKCSMRGLIWKDSMHRLRVCVWIWKASRTERTGRTGRASRRRRTGSFGGTGRTGGA